MSKFTMSRRDLLKALGLTAVGALAAACAPAATPTAAPKGEEPVGEEVPAEPGETRPMKGNLYLEGFPLVEEKETLVFFAPHNTAVEDYYTNHFVVTYEEMTGVHIEWELVPPAGLTEKKNLAFASGDLPDCFFGAGISSSEVVRYGVKEGMLIPIEELIELYNPECQKVFTETPEGELGKKVLTAPDGHIYQYPNYSFCYHCTYPEKFWINTKWLGNVGMITPQSTDEYYEVLKAFQAEDANANGDPNDEIPFSGSTGWSTTPIPWLMRAFIYDHPGNHVFIVEGKVDISANKPEYKDGLEYLAKLYAEGLMDREAFTQDLDLLRQKIQNPDFALVGSAPHMHYLGIAGPDSGDPNERADEYDVVPPLKGPQGVQTCYYNPYVVGGGKYVITSACQHPELAARWIDWFYTEEGLLLQKYGREGIEWYHPGPDSGEMGHGEGLGPMPARFNWMPGKGWTETLQNVTLNQQGPIYEKREFRGAWTSTPESPLEPRLVEATDQYVGYEPEEIWPPVIMTLEETEELAQLGTQVQDYISEMSARFVTGELDIDAEWDQYLETLDELGIERYVEIHQDAYDRFLAS